MQENLKTFFSFTCNPYCGENVTLLLPNVRNVRRTLGPNFEHFRTSQFSPKPNFEPPEHPKKPNSSRTPDSSFQDYSKDSKLPYHALKFIKHRGIYDLGYVYKLCLGTHYYSSIAITYSGRRKNLTHTTMSSSVQRLVATNSAELQTRGLKLNIAAAARGERKMNL